MYNPNRFGPHASKHRLRQGLAFDIELGHDLLQLSSRNEVRKYLNETKPGLVVVSPPCTMMSIMQNMNQKYLQDPDKYKQYVRRLIEARTLWNFGIEICKTVMAYGGTFVLEQPWTSKAWKENRTQGLLTNPSTILVKNDQCQFGLVSENGNPHLKPTGWLTNNHTDGEFLQAGWILACVRFCPHLV